MRWIRVTLPVLVALLLLTGMAQANGTPAIDWRVIGGGGGHVAAAPYTLDGTIGQPLVGVAADTGYALCSGFWCGAVTHRVYLPLVLRDYA